ncbi:MAG: Brp/Blh family beta-carotene 15,15'-dioxygenase [Alphaproteobacteria bacterium]|nr:Brp/Blh family beta-carotene 15,15'-dioxygenase [Alphaproteobacteria bacterium SS10]
MSSESQPRVGPLILIASCAAAVMASVLLGNDLTWQLWFIVPMIAVLGLPHGCLDLEIAKVLRPLPSVQSIVAFLGLYLLIAGAVLLAWMAAPGPALVAFLIYSAVHFGGDWRQHLKRGLHLLPGFAIISVAALLQIEQTIQILAFLAPQDWAVSIALAMKWTACAVVPASIGIMLATRVERVVLVEFTCLMALGLLAPPLVFFTVYFCIAHSPKHIGDTLSALKMPFTNGIRRALPIWLVTMIGAGGAVVLLPAALSVATVQVIFIGLAALTVPHMLLVESLWRRDLAS